MSTSTTSANALQDLIYKGTAWADVAEQRTKTAQAAGEEMAKMVAAA